MIDVFFNRCEANIQEKNEKKKSQPLKNVKN